MARAFNRPSIPSNIRYHSHAHGASGSSGLNAAWVTRLYDERAAEYKEIFGVMNEDVRRAAKNANAVAYRNAQNRRRVGWGQNAKPEYIDGPMDTTTGSPLYKWHLTYDKNGKIINSKMVQVGNLEAFATPDQLRLEAMAKKELREAEDRSLKQFMETQAEYKLFEDIIRKYVFHVSTVFMATAPQTAQELLKLLTGAMAYMHTKGVESIGKVIRDRLDATNRIQMYYTAMQLLQRKRITLLVNDTGLLQASNQMGQILKVASFEVASKIEGIIYVCLTEAFVEAASGLDEDQFPSEYLWLIGQIIQELKSRRAIKVIGKAPNWYIIADFNEFFGGRVEFEQGYHYGATINTMGGKKHINTVGEGPSSPYSGSKVRLPYVSQALNPLRIRYAFWSAIWLNKKFYSPYGTSTRKQHFAAGFEHLGKLADRSALLQSGINSKSQERAQLMNKAMSGRYTAGHRQEAGDRAALLTNEISQAQESLNYIAKDRVYSQKHLYSEPHGKTKGWSGYGPAEMNALKEQTIAARVGYWRGIHKAPVWLLLEFGQLKFEPRTPPRGVWLRFITKARAAVEKIVRETQNEQAAKYYGYTVTSTGEKIVAPQQGEYAFSFMMDGRKLGVGESIPLNEDKEIKATVVKFTITTDIVRRELAKAAALGVNVGPAKSALDKSLKDVQAAAQGLFKGNPNDISSKLGKMPTPEPFIGPPKKYMDSETLAFSAPRINADSVARSNLGKAPSAFTPAPGQLSNFIKERERQKLGLNAEQFKTYKHFKNRSLRAIWYNKVKSRGEG